jgi:O-antigen/teichoic acid export membrane protein
VSSFDDAPAQGLVLRLAGNSLALAAGSLVAAIVGFLTFVAVTRGLGPDAYGHLTAATAFLFIPTVLAEAGLSAAILRQISARPEETEHAIRASLPLRALVSVATLAVALAIALASPLPHLTKVAIAISAVGSLATLLMLSVLPVLQAQLKMHLSVAATLAGRLLTLGVTLAVLAAGLGFRSVVAAQVAGAVLVLVLHVWIVGRLVSLRPIVDTAYWRRLVAGSIAIGLAIALAQAYFRIDAVILALLREPYEVGLYGAAYKFIEISELLVVAIPTSVFPPLARFVATGDPRAAPLVQRAFDVMLAAAAPLAIGMAVFAVPVVVASAGEEFREAADALRLLAPYVLLSFVNGLLFRTLMAHGRDRLLLATTGSALAANIVLNLVFIPVYGFRAAALVSVATEALVLVPLAVAARRRGLAPSVRYVPVVALAAAVMAAVGLLVPGPAAVAMAASVAAYLVVVLVLTGTAREVAFRHLLPVLRRGE